MNSDGHNQGNKSSAHNFNLGNTFPTSMRVLGSRFNREFGVNTTLFMSDLTTESCFQNIFFKNIKFGSVFYMKQRLKDIPGFNMYMGL
jgi:hypothetical protein